MAADDYLNAMAGKQKRMYDKKKKLSQKNLMDILEEFEIQMYARKYETLLKKRCNDWTCITEKAGDDDVNEELDADVFVTSVPPTTTKKPTGWSWWNNLWWKRKRRLGQ